jgi:anti-sigma B factor antagonist
VGVTGELDVATSPMLRDSLLALVNRGAESLVVDLRGVTFIDSTGVGSLLRIHHRQGLLGGRVHFVADQQAVLRVLDLMQLTRRLHVTDTVAAVASCCPAGPVVELRPHVAAR